MANYNAGDLNLTIRTSAEDTLKYLDAVIERLTFIDKHLGGIRGNSYIQKSISKTPKSNGGLFGLAKIGITIHAVRRLGRFMGNLVQAGSDYTETLNLWQVAMRGNLDTAEQFINKMQKAYGISSKTLMNAQAIFKNMIGSLGQISDETAYKISEALVQMSADFSSLYNVKLESAFQKMQSMLAGQVRPIRSAGLDMTETTLFQYYQQLGGTKTMRQLNRTEKQLLSILAVFKQMGSAGALGDMTKTLNQFANQSRMMTQYWQELKTWSGLLLKDLIDQSGMLIYINAALITATEIIKAIAKSRGLGKDNFIEGLFETTEATNNEVDELQGKLLDFDKFRSLEGAGQSELAIDEKLIEAIKGYSSEVEKAKNAATELAETWLKFWLNDDGTLTAQAENILDVLESLSKVLLVLISLKFSKWILKSVKSLITLGGAIKLATGLLTTGILYSIIRAIEAFKEGDYVIGILSVAIGVILVGALLKLKLASKGVNVELVRFYSTFGLMTVGITTLVSGISMFISNFDKLSSSAKVWIPILASLAGVITAVAAGLTFMKGNWLGAISLGATVAGIGLMVGTQLSIPNYEMGASDIDSGTIFRAGEFGKTEAVYTGSNGKTNVANVKQMEQAFYNALARHTAEGNDKIVVQAYLDGDKVYENTTSKAKARGKVWAKA